MMIQWLCIKDCHAVLKVVNHGELFCASGFEHTMIHTHWHSIAHQDSQPLDQHNKP
jgi:hypothetical protein